MDRIAETYKKMITEGNDDPEQNARIAAIWKKTADMHPSDYVWGADMDRKIPAHQKDHSPENEASKERVKAYLRQHAHSLGAPTIFRTANPKLVKAFSED